MHRRYRTHPFLPYVSPDASSDAPRPGTSDADRARTVPDWTARLARPTPPVGEPPTAGGVPGPDVAIAAALARLGDPSERHVGVATAVVPLMGEHTRYVDGFALHLPLRDVVAVAARPSDALTVDADADLAASVRAALDALGPLVPGLVAHAIAVETPLAPGLVDARVLGAAAALVGALAPDLPLAAAQHVVRHAATSVLGVPVSRSDAAAALVGRRGTVVLSDAASGETLALDLPAGLAWGLVPTGEARSPVRVAALNRRAERARDYVASMHRPIASLREIEHAELAGLLEQAPPEHRSALAYLVGEDRRVQRFVAALRQGDAQMMGALLALSAHARNDWARLTDPERAALDALDARTGEGVYGATDVGYVRLLLVLARPAGLASALAAAARALGVEPAIAV